MLYQVMMNQSDFTKFQQIVRDLDPIDTFVPMQNIKDVEPLLRFLDLNASI